MVKKERNSILELLRLAASLWVMYYHGLSLITRSEMFRNGRIAVDFFFILSGLFFLSGFAKEKDKKFFVGLGNFVYKRFKPFMVTFIICFVFSIVYFIQFYEGFFNTGLFGYLWYIPHLLSVLAIYFCLKRLIKSDKAFYIVTAVISVICYALILTRVTDYGIYRGLAGIGMGILLSLIPNLNSKAGKVSAKIIAPLCFILITLIAVLHPSEYLQDSVCLLVLFPALIYFSKQIDFSNRVVNGVCSISFGLYFYQTIARVLEANKWIEDGRVLFLIVLALAIIDRLVAYFIKIGRKKKMENIKEKISCMAIIISKQNKVLVVNSEGEWVFNKGHLEIGESLVACAIREVYEEAGLVLNESECLGQVDEFRFYFDKEKAVKVIKVFAFLIDGEREVSLNEGEGFVSYNWLEFEKAKQCLTHNDAKGALEKAINTVKNKTV